MTQQKMIWKTLRRNAAGVGVTIFYAGTIRGVRVRTCECAAAAASASASVPMTQVGGVGTVKYKGPTESGRCGISREKLTCSSLGPDLCVRVRGCGSGCGGVLPNEEMWATVLKAHGMGEGVLPRGGS